MNYLNSLYLWGSLLIGILSLGIAGAVYTQKKNTLIRAFLFFYASFTLFTVCNLFFSFGENTPSSPASLLDYAYLLALHLLTFTIPFLTHRLFSVGHVVFKDRMWGGITLLVSPTCFLLQYFADTDLLHALTETLALLGVMMAVVYSLLSGACYYNSVQPPAQRALAGKFFILLMLSLPVTIEDLFLEISPFELHPLLYLSMGILFLSAFLTYSATPHNAHDTSSDTRSLSDANQTEAQEPAPSSENAAAAPNASDVRCEQFGISPREKEVLLLVLKGYSNIRIAEELFISERTVKAHLSNIYQKCGVKSRYEIIALFTHITLPSSPDAQ